MQRKIFIVAILVTLTLTGCLMVSNSRQSLVKGRVIGTSGFPVPGVTVELDGKTVEPDRSGYFEVKGVSHGPQTLKVIVDGDVVATEDITVSGAVTVVDDIAVYDEDGFVELTDWTTSGDDEVKGTWTVFDDDGFRMSQTDADEGVTNAFIQWSQQGPRIVYEWSMTFESELESDDAGGLHFLAADKRPSKGGGYNGDSYLVFQRATNINVFRYEAGNSTPHDDISFRDVPAAEGETHRYRVIMHIDTGVIEVYRNGEFIGDWVDDDPIQSGQFIAARTKNAAVTYSNIRIRIDE